MADLTYKQLQQQVTDLQKSVTKGSDAIRAAAGRIDDEAKDTARVAEMIGGMNVDTATTSETSELARIMQGISQAADAYAAAGDTTARAAKAAHEQVRASHDGIQEAFLRAPVDKIDEVNSAWYRQE